MKRRKKILYRLDTEKNRFYNVKTDKYVKYKPQLKRFITLKDIALFDAYIRRKKNISVYGTKKSLLKKYAVLRDLEKDKQKLRTTKNKKFNKTTGKYEKIKVTSPKEIKKYNTPKLQKNFIRSTLKTLVIMVSNKKGKSPKVNRQPYISKEGVYTINELFRSGGARFLKNWIEYNFEDGYYIDTFSMAYKVYDKGTGTYPYPPIYINSYDDFLRYL